MNELHERFIKKHGEQYRRIITDSLNWLDKKERERQKLYPELPRLDREIFIEDLVRGAIKVKDATGYLPNRFGGLK